MSTLVVGDVHGCAHELALLVQLAGADRVVLVGDLYTKGPDPVGVWSQIRDGGFDAVLGNHDQRLLDVVSGERASDKHGAKVVSLLDGADPEWLTHLQTLPLFADAAPFTVVHAGIHPSGKKKKTTHEMAINLRHFPADKPGCTLWWQQYRGSRQIIFGHDARRGLVQVRRKGKLKVLGLDTGCVYGGQLSGYLVEEDRVLQVSARRVYRPV